MTSDSANQQPSRTRKTSILAALAYSPRTAAVACEARRLAHALDAGLTFLHVGKDTDETRKIIERAIQEAGLGVPPSSVLVRPGRVDTIVCNAAKEIGADLIVLGALEKEGPVEYYLGSAARRIARNAPCSVLLLTEPRNEPAAFQRIVVTVQFDEASKAMMKVALGLARRDGVQAIHVVSEYDLFGFHLAMADGTDLGEAEDYKQVAQSEEDMKLVDFLEDFDFQGIRVLRASLRGKEGWESVEYARTHQADLLFFPAPPRRLTFWDQFFQHGVEFALESLPCSLFLFRPQAKQKR